MFAIKAFVILAFAFFTGTAGQSCPLGWTYGLGSCYSIGYIPTGWVEAQRFCEKLGARLVDTETKAEQDFVADLARRFTGGSVFIGAINKFNGWRWIESFDPIGDSFTNWGAGQPIDYEGGPECMVLYAPDGYKWHSVPCTEKNSYICAYEVDV